MSCERCGCRMVGGLCQNYGCESPRIPSSHLLGNYARGGDNRAMCGVIITLPDTLARSGEPTCQQCALLNEEDAVHLLSLKATDAPGMSQRMVTRIAQVRVQLRRARTLAKFKESPHSEDR